MDVDVIIVGAGVAGIGAAIHQRKTSRSFVVLEARDRIGGRVYTDHETFSLTSIDLGASWIHYCGPNNPMYSYYQKYKTDKQDDSDDDDEEEVLNQVCEASNFAALSTKQRETIDQNMICDKWISFGYGTLLERIVNEHQLSIRLNTIVTRIDTSASDRIAVSISAAGFPIFCHRIVVAIPLGCL
ncbi:unnamed protein product [Rotaria sp. Silwood1]|nr:unnamed protein product [Rotaria sp. Silwood1]